jgi:hypothetical protein
MSNLKFRSPNTTSQVQPVDKGVTKKFEDIRHAELVNYVLEPIKKIY